MFDSKAVERATGAERVVEAFFTEARAFKLCAWFSGGAWLGAARDHPWTTDEAIALLWDAST